MATINNLCCSAAAATRNHPALYSSCSKFISNNITTIPFSSSFHFSTKLPINRFIKSKCSASNSLVEAKTAEEEVIEENYDVPSSKPNFGIMAAAVALTVGIAVLLIDEQKAMALGPEGPLAEEFWENMRRYALYALTVSTGVAYAVFQPLYELLRNPISAILIITIAVGGIYLVSQVLSAMVGVSDFNYQYSY